MEVGRSGSVEHVVTAADTAEALGSGDVPVLGTPRVVALAEAATLVALGGTLAARETSLGTLVEVEHLRPSAVGSVVRAEATVTAVEGSRVELAVTVTQEGRVVALGRVARAVVDRAAFLGRL